MTQTQSFYLILTVFIMEILSGAEIDIFVPGFPEIQKDFQLTPFMVELTLGVNMVAQCIFSLIVGNLGDRYGRKPTILWGLLIFTLGTLMCAQAQNFNILLCGRFLQGIGISAPTVLSYILIADTYSAARQQQILGLINGAISLAMAFAPVIGSYVTFYFHWKGNFFILLILSAICGLMCLYLKDDYKPNPRVSLSLSEYIPIIKSPKALMYILTMNFFSLAWWVFIGISPILFIDDLGVSLKNFGYYQGGIAVAFAIFSFLSGFLLKRFGYKKCFYSSMGIISLFIIVIMGMISFNLNDPIIITSAMILFSIGIIIPVNILWPKMLQCVPNAKSRLSAIATSTRLVITAVSLQIVSYFYKHTFTSLGYALLFIIIIGLILCYQLFKMEKGILNSTFLHINLTPSNKKKIKQTKNNAEIKVDPKFNRS